MKRNILGKNLQDLRKNRGIKQQSLAKELGISKQHLSNIESGRRLPSLDILKKISKYFNVDYSDLLEVNEETIRNVYLGNSELTEDRTDHYLAEAVYSSNPIMLEDALSKKQESLDNCGIKIDINDFIKNKSLKKQLLFVKKRIQSKDFSLLFLMRELTIKYVSRALGEGNLNDLSTSIDALKIFCRNLPENLLNSHPQSKLLESFSVIYELCCTVSAIMSNEQLLEKHMSKDCFVIPTQSEKEKMKKEYEKESIYPQTLTMQIMRKAG